MDRKLVGNINEHWLCPFDGQIVWVAKFIPVEDSNEWDDR